MAEISDITMSQWWRIHRMNRIVRRLGREGDFIILLYCGKDGVCASSDMDDESREKLTDILQHTLEYDKRVKGVVLDAVADYLRPLEVDKKLFLERLNNKEQ